MPRFFKENFEEAPFIDGDDAFHIAKSLRMRPGEHITVCDTKGQVFLCTVKSVSDSMVEVNIESRRTDVSEPSVKVTLFQCMPKGDKLDTVVRQSVELGVCSITPVISERCISRPDEKQAEKRKKRLCKIAAEAAGQSGRGIIPQVNMPITIKQLIKETEKFDKCIFLYELGGKPLNEINLSNKGSIALIVGPEGGFSAEEAKLIAESGAETTTLGPRILRTETAPIAGLSAIMLMTGNMR